MLAGGGSDRRYDSCKDTGTDPNPIPSPSPNPRPNPSPNPNPNANPNPNPSPYPNQDTGTGGPARVPLYAPLPTPKGGSWQGASTEELDEITRSSGEIVISPISSVLAHFGDDVSAPEAGPRRPNPKP